MYNHARREAVFVDYGLPSDFNINGYENWLPCHSRCNQSKGERTSEFVPGIKAILDRLRAKAKDVERVDSVALNIGKDKVFKTIFAGLEKRRLPPSTWNSSLTRSSEILQPAACLMTWSFSTTASG